MEYSTITDGHSTPDVRTQAEPSTVDQQTVVYTTILMLKRFYSAQSHNIRLTVHYTIVTIYRGKSYAIKAQ